MSLVERKATRDEAFLATRMKEAGLVVPASVEVAESNRIRESAMVRRDQCVRRAERLEGRAMRKPIGSNGRVKDLAACDQLRAEASALQGHFDL